MNFFKQWPATKQEFDGLTDDEVVALMKQSLDAIAAEMERIEAELAKEAGK